MLNHSEYRLLFCLSQWLQNLQSFRNFKTTREKQKLPMLLIRYHD